MNRESLKSVYKFDSLQRESLGDSQKILVLSKITRNKKQDNKNMKLKKSIKKNIYEISKLFIFILSYFYSRKSLKEYNCCKYIVEHGY